MDEEIYGTAERRRVGERAVYQIRVAGNLDERWSEWVSGLTVAAGPAREGTPVTTLTGLVDQAALRGILNKVWDLNLTLVSVVSIEGGSE